MSSGIALLYCRSAFEPPRPLTLTSATRPGMIVSAGMKIFGYAPMSGGRRAADMLFADSARWTWAKFVVQYPNDRTKPRPNTIAIQLASIGFVTLPTPR